MKSPQTADSISLPIASEVEGLIFDLDGTLADTMSIHFDAWHEAMTEFGKEITTQFIIDRSGRPTSDIVAELNEHHGFNLDPTRFTERKEALVLDRLRTVKPFEPTARIVRERQGEFRMAVASGGVRSNVEATLAAIGLREHFAVVLTADDPVPHKPSPDIFLEAARLMGIAPHRCQVFEDADPGIEAARAAGMHVVDVRQYF